MREKIRIASGQGFWGDMLDAPVRQVEDGPIDYISSIPGRITMSSCKHRARDLWGYARDLVAAYEAILPRRRTEYSRLRQRRGRQREGLPSQCAKVA